MGTFAAKQAPASPRLISSFAKPASPDRLARNYRRLGPESRESTSQLGAQSTRSDPDTSNPPVPGNRPAFFPIDLTSIPVHTTRTPVLQTKLAINTPGDRYEQEADRVAEQVMRMPLGALQPTAPFSNMLAPAAPRLQREYACGGACSDCQKEKLKPEPEKLQRKASTSPATALPSPAAAPPIVHQVLRSPGQPLDAGTRAFMEPRLGQSAAVDYRPEVQS
jgi:hypothetical protein